MIMFGSYFWTVMIVLGGALVVIANLQYNRAKEIEDRRAVAAEARSVLQPEIERNYQRLTKMKGLIEKKQLPAKTVSDFGPVSLRACY